jgi:hypothetical protein
MNVARLAPVKGHEVLVRAMARVVAERPRAVLVLVGEPWSGQPEGLRSLAERLGIGASVLFAGRREDVPALLALADVCVSSSVGSEENSRAVGEYMAAGRAVVATSVGVVPELVEHGVSGLLAPPGDEAALASSLLAVLSDRALAGRMGADGRRLTEERFSTGAFSAGLAAVLDAAWVRSRGCSSRTRCGASAAASAGRSRRPRGSPAGDTMSPSRSGRAEPSRGARRRPATAFSSSRCPETSTLRRRSVSPRG